MLETLRVFTILAVHMIQDVNLHLILISEIHTAWCNAAGSSRYYLHEGSPEFSVERDAIFQISKMFILSMLEEAQKKVSQSEGSNSQHVSSLEIQNSNKKDSSEDIFKAGIYVIAVLFLFLYCCVIFSILMYVYVYTYIYYGLAVLFIFIIFTTE